jgi:hypothetical protein
MTREEFILRIAMARLAGQRKSGRPVDSASATAYANQVADKPSCRGCDSFRRPSGVPGPFFWDAEQI